MKTLGIYIHVPYCKSKCNYCDFYSVTDLSGAGRYADAVLLHMEDYQESAKGYDVDTVFFGGGTPTCIPADVICRILNGVKDHFHLRSDSEITVEMNPATATPAALKKLRRAGVNRLSIGLQSAHDSELGVLGRIHTFEDFGKSFADARKAGFDNINVDIMYAVPNQTRRSLRETLEAVTDLEPEHISLYGLKIEDGTPLYKIKETLALPDEDTEAKMYFESIDFLAEKGYRQYEISNFSKPGKMCLHNLKYWNCDEYLGFGPAAHSYFRGFRFAYKKDIRAYVEAMEYPSRKPDILSEKYEIPVSERLGEYVMLRLRLTEGVDEDAFAERFGLSFERMFGKYLRLYTENGFMEKNGRFYRFTPKGMFVSNYILSAMLDFESELISGVADGTDR